MTAALSSSSLGPGIGLIRNSTRAQIDNPRSLKQAEDVERLLRSRGCETVELLYEQGTSGADLAKRPVARALIEALEAGRYGALAVVDIGRASRDPDGIDQRIFKRACRKGRVLFLTPNRAYDFRHADDEFAFDIEAAIAGREYRDITKRLWDGLTKRAELAPVFRGTVPAGFRAVVSPLTIGKKTTSVRQLEKDPAQAPMMAALVDALETEPNLQRVVDRLNRAGLRAPGAGPWTQGRMRKTLSNPLYWGVWEFGYTGQKSDLWDAIPQAIRHELPELAYWDELRAARWRRTFSQPTRGPAVRRRTYDHPLLGVVYCKGCRQPMIAGGTKGLRCAWRLRSGCSRPQSVREEYAWRTIVPHLADWIRTSKDETESILQDASEMYRGQRESVSAALAELDAREEALLDLAGDEPTAKLRERLDRIKAERSEIEQRLPPTDAAVQAAEDRARLIEALGDDPLGWLRYARPDEVNAFLREVVEFVMLDCHRSGSRVNWWVDEVRLR